MDVKSLALELRSVIASIWWLVSGLPDPFAKVTIDGSGQCHSTESCKNTLDPKWNQHFDLWVHFSACQFVWICIVARDVNESLESRSFSQSRENNFWTSENRKTVRPIVSGIIVTCRSALAIDWSLVCFTSAVARIPDTQTPQNKGQWCFKVVGDSSGRCFSRRVLITLVMPLHRPGSANAAASVCLYRKQKRSLSTAALEQTPNVPSHVAIFHMYSGSLPMSVNICTAPD